MTFRQMRRYLIIVVVRMVKTPKFGVKLLSNFCV